MIQAFQGEVNFRQQKGGRDETSQPARPPQVKHAPGNSIKGA